MILLLILTFGINYFVQESILKKELQLKPETRTIILGDSHTSWAIDPQYLTATENLSKGNENLFYSYYKLKRILKERDSNESLRLILSLGYHSFFKPREYMFQSEDGPLMMKRYMRFLDWDGIKRISQNLPEFRVNVLKYKFGIPFMISETIEELADDYPSHTRRYVEFNYSIKVNKTHGRKKADNHFFIDGKMEHSEMMSEYLVKILELCQGNQMDVILLNTPKHPFYLEKVPPEAVAYYEFEVAGILGKYDFVDHLDFAEKKFQDWDFRDTDHLNSCGAPEFSKFLTGVLE